MFIFDVIDDCTEDGGKEFFTKMHWVLLSNSYRIVKTRNSNAVHLGKKRNAIVYSDSDVFYTCWKNQDSTDRNNHY